MSKIYARPLAVAALAMALAVGTAGCQTMADLDPTGLLGGDDSAATESQFPPDSQQQAAADASTTTPDLAAIPARPPAPDTTAQANTTQQVTAAGAQAQYSADALRAGTDAAAPPPTAADAAATRQALAAADAPPSANVPTISCRCPPPSADAPPTADAPPSAGSDLPPSAGAPAPTACGYAPVNPNAAVPPPHPGGVRRAAAARAARRSRPRRLSPSAAPVASAAAAAPPPGAEPAVPAVPMTAGAPHGHGQSHRRPAGLQAVFRPAADRRPVNGWRRRSWRITARPRPWPAPPAPAARGGSGRRRVAAAAATSGDVVANLDGVPGTPGRHGRRHEWRHSAHRDHLFPRRRHQPVGAAMAEVRQAVAAFKAGGGAGTIKVVGHASSRTANMPVERHLEVIFQKSQARANAVAQALIQAGRSGGPGADRGGGRQPARLLRIHAQGRRRQPPGRDFRTGLSYRPMPSRHPE